MQAVYILLIFLFSSCFAQAQADTLNHRNAKGKKHGYWQVLLNEKAEPVDSLKNACFYGIEFWDNGEAVFDFSRQRSEKMIFEGSVPVKGQPIPVTGTFKYYGKKGWLVAEEVYQNGQPLLIKSFHDPKTALDTVLSVFEELDFTKKYNNIPGTFFYQEHLRATINQYWFRKGNRGWRTYKIEP